MEYCNYTNRIKPLKNFDTFEKPPNEYKEAGKFSLKKGNMIKTTVTKTKFSQLNDKRFCFPNDILSLPYGHPSLEEIENFKIEQGQKIEQCFWQKKDELLKMEKKALEKTPRLELYHQILTPEPSIINLNEKSDFKSLYAKKVRKNIKDIVLF